MSLKTSTTLPVVLVMLAGTIVAAQTFMPWGQSTIESVDLVDGKMYVTVRKPSMFRYPEGGGPPDEMVRMTYVASNGAVVRERTVKGVVVPARTIPERVEWPEGEGPKVPKYEWVKNADLVTSNYLYTNMVVWAGMSLESLTRTNIMGVHSNKGAGHGRED